MFGNGQLAPILHNGMAARLLYTLHWHWHTNATLQYIFESSSYIVDRYHYLNPMNLYRVVDSLE